MRVVPLLATSQFLEPKESFFDAVQFIANAFCLRDYNSSVSIAFELWQSFIPLELDNIIVKNYIDVSAVLLRQLLYVYEFGKPFNRFKVARCRQLK